MKLVWSLLASVACICGASNLAAKSDAVDNGSYTSKDKEYYLSTEQLLFIRPGLELEIIEVIIPADTQLEVTYRLSDPSGLGLDIDGIYTPGPIDVLRYSLTYIPQGEEKKVVIAGFLYDSGGTTTALGDGKYMYKFATVLGDNENYDPDTTHTLAIHARRDLTEFNLDHYVDDEIYNFVPSGASAPMPRDIVTTETCNRCHDPIGMHASYGGPWVEVEWCSQCHNETTDMWSENLRFELMIHKIHAAQTFDGHDFSGVHYPAELSACEVCHTGGTPTGDFPLVANPNPVVVCDQTGKGTTEISWAGLDPFEIRMGTPDGKLFFSGEGTGSADTTKWVTDETIFVLVDKATGDTMQELRVDATVLGCVDNAPGTFRGEPGTQHTNWLNRLSRKTCGSCHDYIDWETGEGHSKYEIVQPDDVYCENCHKPDSTTQEFGMTVRGSHKELYKSGQFPGVLVEILGITDTNPGDTPTVTFSIGAKKGKLNPNDLNRLRFAITGPNEDFDVYIQETANGNAKVAGDNWTYTFETPIPMDSEGSFTVSVEGRNTVAIDLGDEISDERDQVESSLMEFAVTGDVAKPRRMVVDDAKCENCHSNLSLHGDNRKNAQYCTTCHYPAATDAAVRPEGELPDESIHFKYMIHKIHRGQELENGYVVYGYRSSLHDYSHVEYPGDLRNCDACHVNDTQQLPLPADVLPTVTPWDWWTPTDPAAAACLSCHDDDEAASHAAANTSFIGESCSVCHGEGKDAAVNKVHAK